MNNLGGLDCSHARNLVAYVFLSVSRPPPGVQECATTTAVDEDRQRRNSIPLLRLGIVPVTVCCFSSASPVFCVFSLGSIDKSTSVLFCVS